MERRDRPSFPIRTLPSILALLAVPHFVQAQLDPERRNLIELGYDQPLVGQGPMAAYAYYYYNNPEFVRTNLTMRLAVAPAYLDGELGFKRLLSPTTDLGLGFYGGVYGDNYYEVLQGDYRKAESFDGHGGGASLSIYQLLNPGQLIPLNLIARAGGRYTLYTETSDTADNFVLPQDRTTTFVRGGLRLAGKEPMLYPDLGLEISAWFERQWRFGTRNFGFNGDRGVDANASLYWAYAGLNYTWTNIGHKISLAATSGGADDVDRFSAWRLGGVLPLVSEFPLILPGYFYQELTARRFVHLYSAYEIPLDGKFRWKVRLEAAAALLNYLQGFEQPRPWQTGVGCALGFAPFAKRLQVVLRYGYGFNALRDGREGGHSVGVLLQYDFGPRRTR